jgi:hypothetical protein
MGTQVIDVTATIGAAMGEVLLRQPLAADEDFFVCGGDSLRAIEVLQRLAGNEALADQLGTVEMQATLLEAIFEDASPAGLAKVVAARC